MCVIFSKIVSMNNYYYRVWNYHTLLPVVWGQTRGRIKPVEGDPLAQTDNRKRIIPTKLNFYRRSSRNHRSSNLKIIQSAKNFNKYFLFGNWVNTKLSYSQKRTFWGVLRSPKLDFYSLMLDEGSSNHVAESSR